MAESLLSLGQIFRRVKICIFLFLCIKLVITFCYKLRRLECTYKSNNLRLFRSLVTFTGVLERNGVQRSKEGGKAIAATAVIEESKQILDKVQYRYYKRL